MELNEREILERVTVLTARVMYQIAEEIGGGDIKKGFNSIADTLQRSGSPELPDCFWERTEEEDGVTHAEINKFGKTFSGTAVCAEEDSGVQSEVIGEQIAAGRAEIAYCQYIIQEILKPRAKVLGHTAHCIKQGVAAHSYIAKMACRQYSIVCKDIHNMKKLIEANRVIINLLSDFTNIENLEG